MPDYLRRAIVSNVEGAPEPQVRTAGVPSGTSVLGLAKHPGYAERSISSARRVRT